MLARFFIDRPIAAWVISIVILLAGGAAVATLPIAQYPEITPPSVLVTCQYPGASAAVVADTVAAPIEQQVNGVENMLYMSSQSTNDGSYTLTVTFELGTNLNMAQVLVQNRVNQALPILPEVVKATGVIVNKQSPSILLAVNLYSDVNPKTNKPYFNQLFLSNFATIQVRDQLARIKGVGQVNLLGQLDYSMRVWLDPEKLASRSLTADDVVQVLREQNVQVAAGQIGQPPVPTGQSFQYSMTTLGRLKEPEEFGAIVVKTGTAGDVTRLRDVSRIELGAKNQNTQCSLDGKPSIGLAVFQLPGSNALDVADQVKAKMRELKQSAFAQYEGLQYDIVYDTTPFIKESVMEVFKTLRDAVILVALVVLLFLQDWKSVVLPLIDVAVSLVGTFAIMALMGFTLNNLTLFGLVLAIGIVVDDAIVVLENIERWMSLGYPVREATLKAMTEITGPIIAITLVLCSVFLPSALLIGGITGQFYKQFALTIAASMVLSATNAMTMTPARATAVFGHRTPGQHHHNLEALPPWGITAIAGFLLAWFVTPFFVSAPHGEEASEFDAKLWIVRGVLFAVGAVGGWFAAKPVNHFLGILFRGFNRMFEVITLGYGGIVSRMLRLSLIVLFVYAGMLGLTYVGFTKVPIGFIPSQDKGYLVVDLRLPDSASLERTVAAAKKVEEIALSIDGVGHTLSIPGMAVVLNSAVGSNFGSMYVVLKPFHDRHGGDEYADAIAAKLRKLCYEQVLEARVSVFGAPPVDGLGSAGGFKLMVEDRAALGFNALEEQADQLAANGLQQRGLVGLFNSFRANTPQLYVDIDRTKCKTLGVQLNSVFNTLQVYLGGYYVNDFNQFDRTWQVNLQADSQFRLDAEDVRQLQVRNMKGEMIPLGTIANVVDSTGPVMVTRYNMYPAAAINGASLPGVSTGTVIKTMDTLAQQLAPGLQTEWTELTFMQIAAGNTAIYAFAGAIILVFLVLAFLYESWSQPMAVILVVPLCLSCALVGVALARMDINIFVQVGFVVLVGLAAKNAILVVEFARELRAKEGLSVFDATLQASRVRLRPIIMTSFAFILGVVPLMLGHGAGAEMRKTLGVAVFSGMLGVTMFGIFMTPVFYYVLSVWFKAPAVAPGSHDSTGSHDSVESHASSQEAKGHAPPPAGPAAHHPKTKSSDT